ncbi:MAG: hypothetical protein IPN77_19295 [Sandaracinaceae bacterium]|nr:hypothetical protein [Sandaracinaceae bacterium]
MFLYYEDVACTFLEWTWDNGRIVSLHPAWRDLRPLREIASRGSSPVAPASELVLLLERATP